MGQEQSQNPKTIILFIVIVLILGIGYVLSGKYHLFNGNNMSAVVTVENTLMVDGALPVPAGFPEDIPLENSEIIESATTQYPSQNTRQLSVSYLSSKTIVEKYEEYRNYTNQAGYNVAEEDVNSEVRTLVGTKRGNSLSINIKSEGPKTLVELSYLSK